MLEGSIAFSQSLVSSHSPVEVDGSDTASFALARVPAFLLLDFPLIELPDILVVRVVVPGFDKNFIIIKFVFVYRIVQASRLIGIGFVRKIVRLLRGVPRTAGSAWCSK